VLCRLRFSVAFWHSLEGNGSDPFGSPTSMCILCCAVLCCGVLCRLRFSVAFWHSFKGDGSDPFGSGTKAWPWNADKDPLQASFKAMHANFELMSKLGVERWCFHDRFVCVWGGGIVCVETGFACCDTQHEHVRTQCDAEVGVLTEGVQWRLASYRTVKGHARKR
jgi:xylose isomerase